MHWSDRYLGVPYVAGAHDCAALAQQVAGEILGLPVNVPAVRRDGAFGRSAQIQAHRDELAERVADPVDGHPVLMVCRGRLQHIGVACRLAGEWWVLHADEDFGAVIRQRLRDLPPAGIKVEGFYRWKTIT